MMAELECELWSSPLNGAINAGCEDVMMVSEDGGQKQGTAAVPEVKCLNDVLQCLLLKT
jgi:hypothetical protein